MRFAILGSGSKGNSLVIESGTTRLLIDAGYSPRETKARLESLGLALTDLTALLITHGHGDHVKGAKQLAGALGLPTYTTAETKRFTAAFGGIRNHVPVVAGTPFRVADLEIFPAATPHDAPGSVAYVVDNGDEVFGICTDLGAPAESVGAALARCHALVLEFNHDSKMLKDGPYSAALKRRIGSPRGHLNNMDAARLLELAARPHLTRVLLAHLSEVNNTPALALAAARSVIADPAIEVAIAPQHHPTGWLAVRRAGVGRPADSATVTARAPVAPLPPAAAALGVAHRARERQLALFSASTTTTRSA